MSATVLWKAKSKLAGAIGHLGGYAIARQLTQRSPRILMYHRFSPDGSGKGLAVDEFEYQVREIARHFRPVTLSQLVKELNSPQGPGPKSVVITVDDGYEDFHRYAFPVLRKHGVPATVFVTTDFVDGSLWLWPDVLEYALDHCAKKHVSIQVQGQTVEIDLSNADSKKAGWSRLVSTSLSLPDARMRELHADVLRQCGVVLPASPTDEYKPLSWQQIREVDSAGIEIGAHTRTHPALSRIPPERLEEEIAGSKRRIEQELGHPISTFCYPNGTPDDINEQVKATVRAAGFCGAPVAFFDKRVTDDLHELRRYPVGAWRRKFLQAVHGVELLARGHA
ncbi:polysaccharide deacetylase family protein [Peristeroidobacter agariperforans]|uniref:polysaccharide deacetylase family protein n=1 Tax=Peristeroidobacter agariperforans TaxID=268404 RepID=UPI00101D5678|nr:polysaccharide deacetylase family protein [Peristeroidobacter agariperforans]